jgi:DNA-binding response OmpR family regulator
VDAERSVVTVVRRFLERSRNAFQVEVAYDGFDAGRQVATFHPDVVLFDLRLPGIDALDACRRIRETPELSGTRIIAMAAAEDRDMNARAMENGASVILAKPFTPDDLRRALAKVSVDVN